MVQPADETCSTTCNTTIENLNSHVCIHVHVCTCTKYVYIYTYNNYMQTKPVLVRTPEAVLFFFPWKSDCLGVLEK